MMIAIGAIVAIIIIIIIGKSTKVTLRTFTCYSCCFYSDQHLLLSFCRLRYVHIILTGFDLLETNLEKEIF